MASKLKKLSVAADIFEQSVDGSIRKIPLSQIKPTVDQPRQLKDINIATLAESLQVDGLLQPIIVTKDGANGFSIIAGERRYRAAMSIGWKEIECRILNKEGREKFRLAVIENLQRENLDAFEESQAFRRLKEEFNYTDAQLAQAVGKSRNYISEILSIGEIPEDIRQSAREKGIIQKNLLVQLAMAIKNGQTEDFLRAVEAGDVKSVKSAKAFNQNRKAEKQITSPEKDQSAIQAITAPSSFSPDINLQLSWDTENRLKLSGTLGGIPETDKPLSEIESLIISQLKTALQNFSF